MAQLPGVTDGGAGQRGGRLLGRGLQRLLHMQRHRVDQVDLVALGGQGQGVDAGGATNVQHDRGCGWQVAAEQLPGADALQVPGPEPLPLGHAGVVAGDLRVELWVITHPSVLPRHFLDRGRLQLGGIVPFGRVTIRSSRVTRLLRAVKRR
jgi:hypothetical protein